MGTLKEIEIQYGFDHPKFINMERVVEISEYSGENELQIQCTQLSDENYKAKDKKRILSEWIQFLTNNTKAFKKLVFTTRVSQELFNAICCQENLEWLYIKWGVYPDISAISKLSNLEYLYLGSGRSVESIEPIVKLKNLKGLSVENFQNIADFSQIANLKKLESLSIEGDFAAPKFLKVKDLEFLKEMKQLRYFNFLATKLISKDYTPVLCLENLEYLSLRGEKEVREIYEELLKLPKLKYGYVIECPELYKD